MRIQLEKSEFFKKIIIYLFIHIVTIIIVLGVVVQVIHFASSHVISKHDNPVACNCQITSTVNVQQDSNYLNLLRISLQ